MTSNVVRRPRRFAKGDPFPGAARLNELVDPVTRIDRGGPSLQLPPDVPIYVQTFQLKLNFIFDDYLQGVLQTIYSGGTEVLGTTNILVGLPWLLRRTPFHGQTYNGVSYTYTGLHTRTATQASTTETQKITPDYVLGDTLYCARIVLGGSGVAPAIRSIDLNADGRCWACLPP